MCMSKEDREGRGRGRGRGWHASESDSDRTSCRPMGRSVSCIQVLIPSHEFLICKSHSSESFIRVIIYPSHPSESCIRVVDCTSES